MCMPNSKHKIELLYDIHKPVTMQVSTLGVVTLNLCVVYNTMHGKIKALVNDTEKMHWRPKTIDDAQS